MLLKEKDFFQQKSFNLTDEKDKNYEFEIKDFANGIQLTCIEFHTPERVK
jgi:hypothetical protein